MSAELGVLLTLQDDASSGLKSFADNVQGCKQQLNELANTAIVVGGGIVASLTAMAFAAADEDAVMNRLAQTVSNTGVAYETCRGQIEAYLASVMRSTNYTDEQAANALNRLVLVTGDVNTAMAQMPLVLDVAAARQMDLDSAAQAVGRAMDGQYESLNRLFPGINQCTSASEALAFMQGKVTGAAEASVNPFTQLKNTMGELAESIGSAVLPTIKAVVDWIRNVVEAVTGWIDKHKTLAQFITTFALVFGALLLALGSFIKIVLLVVKVKQAWVAVQTALNIAMNLNPIGIIILAIAALIAIIVVIWNKLDGFRAFWGAVWNGIKTVFQTVWDAIKTTFKTVVNIILTIVEGLANGFIRLINVIIKGLNLLGAILGYHIDEIPEVHLPRLEKGGIVTSPTIALIGEAGPEAVIPLGREGGVGGGNINWSGNVIVQGHVLTSQELAQVIREELLKQSRRLGGVATGNLGFT